MSAFGELLIGAMVILAIVGLYFLFSCYVPVVADPPPGTEPKRALSVTRLGIGLACLAISAAGIMTVIAGAGLASLANH